MSHLFEDKYDNLIEAGLSEKEKLLSELERLSIENKKLSEEKFGRALSVLKAAEIILKENKILLDGGLERLIHQTKIDGINFAISCLEEVQK